MDIRLSWDLFILVFFIVIISYSFIIGRDNTLKVILGTYVAALSADAMGNLFEKYFSGSAIFSKVLRLVSVGSEQEAIVFVKVMVFVSLVILFSVRGAFEVHTIDDRSPIMRLILLVVYSFMSAGLIISSVLVFVSGVSIVNIGGAEEAAKTALWDLYNKSSLIRTMINHSNIWFAFPSLAFLVHSLYTKKEE